MKVTVYFRTSDPVTIRKIRDRFRLTEGLSVNGETVGEVREEDIPLLEETARLGFIEIRKKPIK